MKNTYGILAGVITLAALTVSCVAEKDTTPELDITTVRCSIPRIDVEEDFATGILDTLTTTKATFSGGNFLWSAGDKIGIVPNTGAQIYFEVSDGAGTSTASFNGGDWAMKSTGTFYAYYPLYPDIFLSKDHVSVSYTGQTQSGNNNNLHTGDFWTLYTEGTTAVGNALNFSFNHLTSFFKTYVTVPAGTYTKITFSAPTEVFIKDGYFDLSAQTPTIVGTTMTDELSLNLQNVTFADETELTGYLVLAPVDITGIPITVTVYKDGEPTYEYTLTKANPMVAAKTYAFRATSITQLAASATQANALFAAGATSVSITEPLTEDMAIVLPNTSEAVTLILPTTASSSTLTVSYPPAAESYPATLSITGPEGADLNIQTPNSTVTVNGIAYDQVTCRTAANTCIIPVGVTVNNLKVVQGGVQVYGTVSQIDLSEQEDDAIINVSGTVTSLLGEDDEEYVPATGITLNQSAINLAIGDTETLTATVAPVGAYPKVTWSSSDEAVATVSAAGVVTAVAEGSATITARTISEGFTAACDVTTTSAVIRNPLAFTSNGETSISLIKNGNANGVSLRYKIEDGEWEEYTIGTAIALSDGESVSFKAGATGNQNFNNFGLGGFYSFFITGSGTVAASGNIMSLLSTIESTAVTSLCFYRLFYNCNKLTIAPELPATTLASNCYFQMFYNCTDLVSAPELPATTLAHGCYSDMFRDCSSLKYAPNLPATTLVADCYELMFSGCTSLTLAPDLPATTLASDCYQLMFQGCDALTSAPALPATTLASSCYEGMFAYCDALTTAPALPATTLVSSCYRNMFYYCTSLTTAPELPATELEDSCYAGMFEECNNLNYIKMLATGTPEWSLLSIDSCLSNWVNGVSPTGTFIRNKYATWDITGNNGIPTGWLVLTDISIPEAIDLGLPSGTKWASFNIGSSAPEEYGDYFAWGKCSPKNSYPWSNYLFGMKKSLTKYNTDGSCGAVDNLIELDENDDVASSLLGGSWRMPTDSNWQELIENSTSVWTTRNGMNGLLVTSQINGNSIFLPAAGCRYNTNIVNVGSVGYYWSSSLYTHDPVNAWFGYLSSSNFERRSGNRNYGKSIRPVK